MEDGEVLKLRSPKELKTSEKPNSPTSENINSINRDMPRGYNPWSAATTHLMQYVIPRVTKKKKKNSSSSMVVIGLHDDQRIGGSWRRWQDQLKTNTAGKTTSLQRRAQVMPASLTSVKKLFNTFNNVWDDYNAICTNHWGHNKSSITRQEALLKKGVNANHNG